MDDVMEAWRGKLRHQDQLPKAGASCLSWDLTDSGEWCWAFSVRPLATKNSLGASRRARGLKMQFLLF